MSGEIVFEFKPSEQRMKDLMKKLEKVASAREGKRILKTCMVVTQGMIADQFKQGGNVVDANSPLSYRVNKWQNSPKTTKNKQYNGYSSKPGVMTGATQKNFVARNKKAYPVQKVTETGFKLELSSNTQKLGKKKKTRRQRQYIGYFEEQLGIVPDKRALRKVNKFILEGNLDKIIKGKTK